MTKTDLRAHRKAVREARQLKEQLRMLEGTVLSPRPPNLTGMPRSPSGERNPVEEAVLGMQALCERYEAKLAAILAEQERIEQAMERLDPYERMVVREYYIAGKSWERVCEVINYSWRQTHRIHGRALRKLAD